MSELRDINWQLFYKVRIVRYKARIVCHTIYRAKLINKHKGND